MNLTHTCTALLGQLQNLVEQITADDFKAPSRAMNGSSLGQHIRHTLEFFFCLQEGLQKGVVNYDKRKHDMVIESDKFIALAAIRRMEEFIVGLDNNRALTLEVNYGHDETNGVTAETNLYRELIYNIEHAIHHMAMMRIAVQEVAPYIVLPASFGVAVSTLRYQVSRTQLSHQ
jgi:uncharacterized damage-inducible protein DinB